MAGSDEVGSQMHLFLSFYHYIPLTFTGLLKSILDKCKKMLKFAD